MFVVVLKLMLQIIRAILQTHVLWCWHSFFADKIWMLWNAWQLCFLYVWLFFQHTPSWPKGVAFGKQMCFWRKQDQKTLGHQRVAEINSSSICLCQNWWACLTLCVLFWWHCMTWGRTSSGTYVVGPNKWEHSWLIVLSFQCEVTNQKPHQGLDALRAHLANLPDAAGQGLPTGFVWNIFVFPSTDKSENAYISTPTPEAIKQLHSYGKYLESIQPQKRLAKWWCIQQMPSCNLLSRQQGVDIIIGSRISETPMV